MGKSFQANIRDVTLLNRDGIGVVYFVGTQYVESVGA